MAREKGTFNFSANLEVKKQGPLDARQSLITYAELTQAATWQDESGKMYLFNGLIVPVTNGSKKEVYMLVDAAKYNIASSWQQIDGGGVMVRNDVVILPGDLTRLNNSSSAADIKNSYGAYSSLVSNIKLKKVFTGVYEENIVYVSFKKDGNNITARFICGTKIITHTLVSNGTDYTSMTSEVSTLVTSDTIPSGSYLFPGDITTLTNGMEKEAIEAVIGTYSDINSALTKNRVFVGKIGDSSSGYYTINVTQGPNYFMTLSVMYIGRTSANPTVFRIQVNIDSGNFSGTEGLFKQDIVLKGGAVESVTATSGKGIEMGGTATKPTVGLKLDTATPGNVDLSVGANGLKAALSSKAVKTGDKILKVETDKSISATVSLGYDSGTKKLQLKGINEEVFNELDATPFIKDGMLDSATLEVNPSGQSAGTYIKLVFNTESGKDPIYINVTSLIDVYTQGNGISISGKSISVKLDAAGNSEGYLKLTAAGLKVEGVNAAVAAAIAEAFSWHDA